MYGRKTKLTQNNFNARYFGGIRLMFLKIKLKSQKGRTIGFPIQYNYSLQGLVYSMLEPHFADFLHREGYKFEKRRFKMFSFSRILGNFSIDRQKNKIIFTGDIYLYITSPMEDLIRQVSNTLLLEPTLRIGNQILIVDGIKVGQQSVESEKVTIETTSPVTIYSTLYKVDGSKFTYYYNPMEKDFSTLIKNNLIKKYNAFYGENLEQAHFHISPIGKTKENVINYKGTIIKGHSGRFLLEGDKGLLNFALKAGLGGKNSQGFGSIKLR